MAEEAQRNAKLKAQSAKEIMTDLLIVAFRF
jgi:hypothetical protein